MAAFSDFQTSSRSANSRFQLLELLLQIVKPLFGGVVALLFQGLAFDLQLDDAPLEPIHRFGLGVDLDTNPGGRFVDQVNRLVWQLAVGNIAMRQRGCRDDGRVGDFDMPWCTS